MFDVLALGLPWPAPPTGKPSVLAAVLAGAELEAPGEVSDAATIAQLPTESSSSPSFGEVREAFLTFMAVCHSHTTWGEVVKASGPRPSLATKRQQVPDLPAI